MLASKKIEQKERVAQEAQKMSRKKVNNLIRNPSLQKHKHYTDFRVYLQMSKTIE